MASAPNMKQAGSGNLSKFLQEVLSGLVAGQDVGVAMSLADMRAKTLGQRMDVRTAAMNQIMGAAAGLGQQSKDLESSAIASLVIGIVTAAGTSGIDFSEAKRKLVALKTAKSKLKPAFDGAGTGLDKTALSTIKMGNKRASDRLKQMLANMYKKAGINGTDPKGFKKLSKQQFAMVTLIRIFNQAVENPNYGIDAANMTMDQAAMTAMGLKTGQGEVQKEVSDELIGMVNQITIYVKDIKNTQAAQMVKLTRA